MKKENMSKTQDLLDTVIRSDVNKLLSSRYKGVNSMNGRSSINKDFLAGVLVSLHVLRNFDSPVIANEIVASVGGIKKLESCVDKNNIVDMETIAWLKSQS